MGAENSKLFEEALQAATRADDGLNKPVDIPVSPDTIVAIQSVLRRSKERYHRLEVMDKLDPDAPFSQAVDSFNSYTLVEDGSEVNPETTMYSISLSRSALYAVQGEVTNMQGTKEVKNEAVKAVAELYSTHTAETMRQNLHTNSSGS